MSIIGLIVGFVPRWFSHRQLLAETHTDSALTVEVISPVPAKPDLGTPLPAEVQAFVQASIHARASGYLKKWYVDIGDTVTNGQLLAEIDTPEVDQQLAQARAELDQAKANLSLAKITADRWTDLLKTASVSEQETAEKQADYTLKQANVEAAQANVHRLEELEKFCTVSPRRLPAPSPRATPTSASSSPPTAGWNCSVSRRPIRCGFMSACRNNTSMPSCPVRKHSSCFRKCRAEFSPATVTRTAGAVDPASRTLLVELQVPNPDGEILAGSYAQVRFNEAADNHVLTLSDNALIFRAEGMQIARGGCRRQSSFAFRHAGS